MADIHVVEGDSPGAVEDELMAAKKQMQESLNKAESTGVLRIDTGNGVSNDHIGSGSNDHHTKKDPTKFAIIINGHSLVSGSS